MEMQEKLYEWMIKYTPQKEWIERKGKLVWIAEVLTSLGGGLYLVSLILNNLLGMLVGYLIILFLDIPLRVADYGKPLRFWRTIVPFNNTWRTSWFTRGVTLVSLFSGVAFIQLALSFFFPGTVWDIAFKILAGMFAFIVGSYSGFIMNFCRSVPFWNSALLPILSIANSVGDGLFLLTAIWLAGAQVNITSVITGSWIVLIACALLMIIYLWSQTYTSSAAKQSVMLLLSGSLAPAFWIGVVALNLLVPLVISGYGYFTGVSSAPLLFIAIICRLVGAFALKYGLLKAGIYKPLLPATSAMA